MSWYVPNSVNINDIRPIERKAGGGVTESMLCDTYQDAVRKAISILMCRIDTAEKFIRKFEGEL